MIVPRDEVPANRDGIALQPSELAPAAVIDESAKLVTMAAIQIDAALQDGERQMNAVSEAFVVLAERLQQALEISGCETDSAALLTDLQNLIVACQFYDRHSQRIKHAGESLEGISELLGNPQLRATAQAWCELEHRTCARYSTREESELFAETASVMSPDQASNRANSAVVDDDIELF